MPRRIVILGGGYTGIRATTRLARELRGPLDRHEVEVVVVSALAHHSFHGWTGEFLGGIVSLDHSRTPLAGLLPRARLIVGSAEHVDLDDNQVVVRDGQGAAQTLAYDHLVIATGSADNAESVPGLRAHGFALKGNDDLPELRDHIADCLDRADAARDPAVRRRLLTFVVAGGGFTGVEMTAALADLLWAERARRPSLQAVRPRLVLAHSGAAELPELRPRFHRLADYAADQLAAYGIVELKSEVRLEEVDADSARFSDGSVVTTATVLSTVGQRRRPLPGTAALPRDAIGRLRTDKFLRVEGRRDVWAGGDVAAVPMAHEPEPCPTNALWAMQHGEQIGANVGRLLLGKPMAPFTFPGLGQAASLGVGKGATEVYGVQVTGWIGWVARLSLFLWFMPDRGRALQVMDDWLRHARGGQRRLDATAAGLRDPWHTRAAVELLPEALP